MAYVIFSANGDEIDRRELIDERAQITVGRAPDCTICVRDIMLSRRHCALEIQNRKWIVTDLGSKNGTFLAEERIDRHILRDGDSLRMGRTWMIYRAGKFVPGPRWDAEKQRSRPVDPNEAMAGTVVGFELLEPGEAEYNEAMPVPKPRPKDPRGYERDGAALVSEISSNSWDEPAVRSPKAVPRAAVTAAGTKTVRPKSRVSFSLQAHEEKQPTAKQHQPQQRKVEPVEQKPEPDAPKRVRRPLTKLERRVVAACLSVSITLVVCAAFVALQSPGRAELSAGAVVPVRLDERPEPMTELEFDIKPAQPAAVTVNAAQAVEQDAEQTKWAGAEGSKEDGEAKPKRQAMPSREVVIEILVRELLR